jgi:hypothetical protein
MGVSSEWRGKRGEEEKRQGVQTFFLVLGEAWDKRERTGCVRLPECPIPTPLPLLPP